ncbi:hypothetical protein HanPSC8_Chr06g0236381 [Helianthus annuus]|nr:hypothetical protein HanPSC8_Chr06g0236381 [Helianthus annuus]
MGMAHTGMKDCDVVVVITGAKTVVVVVGLFVFRFMSKSGGSFRFLSVVVVVVGMVRVPLTEVAMAGMVPVPVAAIMDGSAWCRSHWMRRWLAFGSSCPDPLLLCGGPWWMTALEVVVGWEPMWWWWLWVVHGGGGMGEGWGRFWFWFWL